MRAWFAGTLVSLVAASAHASDDRIGRLEAVLANEASIYRDTRHAAGVGAMVGGGALVGIGVVNLTRVEERNERILPITTIAIGGAILLGGAISLGVTSDIEDLHRDLARARAEGQEGSALAARIERRWNRLAAAERSQRKTAGVLLVTGGGLLLAGSGIWVAAARDPSGPSLASPFGLLGAVYVTVGAMQLAWTGPIERGFRMWQTAGAIAVAPMPGGGGAIGATWLL